MSFRSFNVRTEIKLILILTCFMPRVKEIDFLPQTRMFSRVPVLKYGTGAVEGDEEQRSVTGTIQ
jgi:hypothetical protein